MEQENKQKLKLLGVIGLLIMALAGFVSFNIYINVDVDEPKDNDSLENILNETEVETELEELNETEVEEELEQEVTLEEIIEEEEKLELLNNTNINVSN